MVKSLGVIIPDYKSSFLEDVIKGALLLKRIIENKNIKKFMKDRKVV